MDNDLFLRKHTEKLVNLLNSLISYCGSMEDDDYKRRAAMYSKMLNALNTGSFDCEGEDGYGQSPANVEKQKDIQFPALDKIKRECYFRGKNICFTGFGTSEKRVLADICECLDISMKSSISGVLEYLVCGANPGPSKIKKCQTLNIPIREIETFLKEISE
jgi:NAD-dependent DNA ligase